MTESLQDFVAALSPGCADKIDFDPSAAELEFDNKSGARAPAWEIDLGGGHKLVVARTH